MRKEEKGNELLVKEIEVLKGKKLSVLIGNGGMLCYRNGATGPWEPCGDENFMVALALNRGILTRT